MPSLPSIERTAGTIWVSGFFIVTIFAISQAAIYAENDWNHLGLTPFFFLLSIAVAVLLTFVLLKVISPVIIVIYRKESWHQIGLLKSSFYLLPFPSQNRQFLDAQIYLFQIPLLIRIMCLIHGKINFKICKWLLAQTLHESFKENQAVVLERLEEL